MSAGRPFVVVAGVFVVLPLSSSLLLLYLFVCPLGSSFVSCVVWHWHTYHASDPDLLALSYLSFSFCVGCCCCTAVLLTMYAYKSEESCARTNLLGYMEDTVWFWNDWREVEFRSGGKFFAPDADNCHDGTTCTWHVTDSGRKVVIRWGTAGEHTVSLSEDRRRMQGQRFEGILATATFGGATWRRGARATRSAGRSWGRMRTTARGCTTCLSLTRSTRQSSRSKSSSAACRASTIRTRTARIRMPR